MTIFGDLSNGVSAIGCFPHNRVQKLLNHSHYDGLTPKVEAEAVFIQLADDDSPTRQVFLALTQKEFFIVKQEISKVVHFIPCTNDTDDSGLVIDHVLPLPCVHFLIVDDTTKFFSIFTYNNTRFRFEMCRLDLDAEHIWQKWREHVLHLGGGGRIPNEKTWRTSYVVDLCHETQSHPKLTRTMIKSAISRTCGCVPIHSSGTQTEVKTIGTQTQTLLDNTALAVEVLAKHTREVNDILDHNSDLAADVQSQPKISQEQNLSKFDIFDPKPDVVTEVQSQLEPKWEQDLNEYDSDSSSSSSEYSLDVKLIGYCPRDRLTTLFTTSKLVSSRETLTQSKLRGSKSLNDIVDTQCRLLDLSSPDPVYHQKLPMERRNVRWNKTKGLDKESSSESEGDNLDELFEKAGTQNGQNGKVTSRGGGELWILVRKLMLQAKKKNFADSFQTVVRQARFRTIENKGKTLPQSVTEIDPYDFSQQLTYTSKKLFLAISPTDLDVYTRTRGKQLTPSLRKVLTLSDDIRKMVVTEVTKARSLSDCVMVLRFFVRVALVLLFRNHDFHSLMAVLQGLTSLPLYRLDNIWATFFVQEPFPFCHFLALIQMLNPSKKNAYISRVKTCIHRRSAYVPHLDNILEHCLMVNKSVDAFLTSGQKEVEDWEHEHEEPTQRSNVSYLQKKFESKKFESPDMSTGADSFPKSILVKEKKRHSLTDMLFRGKKRKRKHRVTFKLDADLEYRHNMREESGEQLKLLSQTILPTVNNALDNDDSESDADSIDSKAEYENDDLVVEEVTGKAVLDNGLTQNNLNRKFEETQVVKDYCDREADVILQDALRKINNLLNVDHIVSESEWETTVEHENGSIDSQEADAIHIKANEEMFVDVKYEDESLKHGPVIYLPKVIEENQSRLQEKAYPVTPAHDYELPESYIKVMTDLYIEPDSDNIETNVENDFETSNTCHLNNDTSVLKPEDSEDVYEAGENRDESKGDISKSVNTDSLRLFSFAKKKSKNEQMESKHSKKRPKFLKRMKNKFKKSEKADDILHSNALQKDIDDIADLMSSFSELDAEEYTDPSVSDTTKRKSYVPLTLENGRRKSLFEEALKATEGEEEKDDELFETLKNVQLIELKKSGSTYLDLLSPDEEYFADASLSNDRSVGSKHSTLITSVTNIFRGKNKSNSCTVGGESYRLRIPHYEESPQHADSYFSMAFVSKENDQNYNSSNYSDRVKSKKAKTGNKENKCTKATYPSSARCLKCNDDSCVYGNGIGNYLVHTQTNLLKAGVHSHQRVKECLNYVFYINAYLSDFDILQLSLYL